MSLRHLLINFKKKHNYCMLSERKDVSKCEELVLNAVATINNLSYYCVATSAVMQRRLDIAQCKFCFDDQVCIIHWRFLRTF